MNKEIIELLLVDGAEVNIQKTWEGTPLDWAIARDRQDVVRLLRAYGGKVSGYCKPSKNGGLSCSYSY